MKPTNILILCALVLSIGWGIVREFQQPEDNSVVSYEQLQVKETEVVHLMEMLTDGLAEPDNKMQRTKEWGSSIITYIYKDPDAEFLNKLRMNIGSKGYWKQSPLPDINDSSIFESYCYKDISLFLSSSQAGVTNEYERFAMHVIWEKDNYCWRQFQSNN